MANLKPIENNLLRSMKDVRECNNVLWMKIVDIALKERPEETKQLLRHIRANDYRITEIWKEIADAPNDAD